MMTLPVVDPSQSWLSHNLAAARQTLQQRTVLVSGRPRTGKTMLAALLTLDRMLTDYRQRPVLLINGPGTADLARTLRDLLMHAVMDSAAAPDALAQRVVVRRPPSSLEQLDAVLPTPQQFCCVATECPTPLVLELWRRVTVEYSGGPSFVMCAPEDSIFGRDFRLLFQHQQRHTTSDIGCWFGTEPVLQRWDR